MTTEIEKDLSQLSDKELKEYHTRLHQIWNLRLILPGGGEKESEELMFEAHLGMVKEMQKRGIEHKHSENELDNFSFNKMLEEYGTKPYPNEHACRLRSPGDFQKGSFRRSTREHDNKEYSVIMGRLVGETTLTEQAYRYGKTIWDADEAKKHCDDHDGRFEPAIKGEKEINRALSWVSKQEIENVILVPDYVSIVGSFVKEKDNPDFDDVDVVIRDDRLTDGLIIRLVQAFKNLPEQIHPIASPSGPHDQHIPIYDLVLARKKDFQIISPLTYEGVISENIQEKYGGMINTSARLVKELALIIPHLEGGILEIGCGTGNAAVILQNSDYDIRCIDEDEDAVKYCESRGLKAELADACNLPFGDKEFDVVYSMHVLEHIEDAKKAFDECNRVARKAIHIVPLGLRINPDHKHQFETIESIKDYFDISDVEEYKDIAHDITQVSTDIGVIIVGQKGEKAITPAGFFTPPKPAISFISTQLDELADKYAKDYIDKKVPLSVEIKLNGIRTIMSKNSRTLVWFEDSKKDQSKRFPDIVDDLKKVGEPVVLDCDFGALDADRKVMSRIHLAHFFAGKDKIPADFVTPGGLKGKLVATVFDIPYWKEDLTDLPWIERRKKLEEFFQKYKFDNIQIVDTYIADTKQELINEIQKVSVVQGSEGAMIKSTQGKYAEASIVDWGKIKNVFEYKAVILDVFPTKTAGVYNYAVGYLDEKGKIKKVTKTMNTSVKASKDDLLTVHSEEVIPIWNEDEGTWEISAVITRVIELEAVRKKPDGVMSIIRGAYKAGILQLTPDLRDRLKFKMWEGYKVELGEGETGAEAFWVDEFYKHYPKSGKGDFVAQDHWRGLNEEESKLSEDALWKTTHSVHSDLRLEVNATLVGFSVFLGKVKDNTPKHRFYDLLSPKTPLQGSWKWLQPKEWLKVGVDKPSISAPGEAGTSKVSYAVFFAKEYGSWEMGVWRKHMFEMFLHGKKGKLNGRYIIQYAPVAAGRRVWLITQPEDQTPYADSRNKEDIIKELKGKGQKYLIWAKPGVKPELIDVEKYKLGEKSRHRKDRCMLCDNPPTIQVLWAEGMAMAWLCDKHANEFRKEHAAHDGFISDINKEQKIDGVAEPEKLTGKSDEVMIGPEWRPTLLATRPHGEHVCICPSCGYKETVKENMRCNIRICPKCGDKMRAEEVGEYYPWKLEGVKLQLEKFRSTGIDYDISNKYKQWRELNADHRYLHIGYARVKAGKKWGDWETSDIVKYHAAIVDTMRSMFFPYMIEQEKGLKRELDLLSRRYEKSSPPKGDEERKEWDTKRSELFEKGRLK